MLFTGVLAHALTPILDLQLVGTVYEEGVFVYVAYGAVLVGLGAIAHWGPKLWGRRDRRTSWRSRSPCSASLATVLAALPLLVAGFQGQPAGAAGDFDYDLAPELLNALVVRRPRPDGDHGRSASSLLALRSFTTGDAAGDDPWDGQTLEWATSSPPPADNFTEIHTVASATPLLDLKPARTDA